MPDTYKTSEYTASFSTAPVLYQDESTQSNGLVWFQTDITHEGDNLAIIGTQESEDNLSYGYLMYKPLEGDYKENWLLQIGLNSIFYNLGDGNPTDRAVAGSHTHLNYLQTVVRKAREASSKPNVVLIDQQKREALVLQLRVAAMSQVSS